MEGSMRIGTEAFSIELDEASALDIGSCLVDGVEIAPGTAVPDDGDSRILRAVGGFLFTCGPDHIRHPEPIEGSEGKRYPLHGSLSGHPATILSDTTDGDSRVVKARIEVTMATGGTAELLRCWRFDLGTGQVGLEDRLTNTGTAPFVPMLMYHMNIGARLFDDHTLLAGASFVDGPIDWRFGAGDGHVFCVPAVAEEGRAHVSLGPIAGAGGRTLDVWFATDTIAHLQMWRNQAGHCDVLGIEPVSHPWKPRAELQTLGLMQPMGLGDHRIYRLGFAFR
jgi:hypothetical protein